jgi:ribonuclease VapC
VKRWLLDTSALLTLRDDEPGAERVAELLHLAQQRRAECLACFMTGMELLYRIWRDEGEAAGRLAHEQCLALPIQWVHESPELLLRSAELKASYPLSLADAWIAASALEANAILVHKDPEFDAVPVAREPLPYKRAG